MTGKRNDNSLHMPPHTSRSAATTDVDLALWSSRQPSNRSDKRLIDEARKRQLAMYIIDTQTRFGLSRIAEIHRHASLVFDETCGFILEAKDQPGRSPQHQAYVDEFSERQVQLLAQTSLAMSDVGATSIGIEIHQSPYPPPSEPARRPGFWQRLLGD